MLTNNTIKYIRSLSQKKYRQKYNNFVIEGEKMILEAILFAKNQIEKIYCVEDFFEKQKNQLEKASDKIEIISIKELQKISNLKTANQGLAVLKSMEERAQNINKYDFIVYLDNIRDPGNMGTIIRTCDWFDVDCIVISEDSVDIYNPKTLQSSMGSIFRIPVFKYDFNRLEELFGDKILKSYGMLMNGESIYETEYDFPLVIVIGNESRGISDQIISKLDKKITIQRFNQYTESLNASIATSIIISEIQRKNL